MIWMTDKSKAILNEWHIVYNAQSDRKFSAMAVLHENKVKWIIDPWCAKKENIEKYTFLENITHFMFYPESPVI